jgi:LPS sulfotransferase NodH
LAARDASHRLRLADAAEVESPMNYRRMHHDEIDAAAWDRPPRDAPPLGRVIICSTPRSGSYLLCRQMINAALGLPTEYFRPQTTAALGARWGVPAGDDGGYVDALESRRTTGNGLFAAKVQWQHQELHACVRERWLERADLLVFLYRSDLVAQAVSWQVSLATGLWSFDATPGPRMEGVTLERSDLTLGLARELRRQNLAWEGLLASLGRRVLKVPYETFVENQGALVSRLAADLAIPAGAWTLPPPEPRESRLPGEVEAARARLLAAARKTLAATRGA